MAATYGRDPHTLMRWVLKGQKKHTDMDLKYDLANIINSIQLACKIITKEASGTGIYHSFSLKGNRGIDYKKLDKFANDAMTNSISFTSKVACMISQQCEKAIVVNDCQEAKYIVAFDALDGSFNIDANVTIGTIFGIYKVLDEKNPIESALQEGRNLLCAGYTIYGDATVMVLTMGHQVTAFTLDPFVGEFILTHENIKIPKKGNIYSINEGYADSFDNGVQIYLKFCKEPPNNMKAKKLRYIGSMVADVHRTLLYGGIFIYPSTKEFPNGKLRLLYEVIPMSFIVEAAGGKAINQKLKNILDIKPADIHERCSVFLGSPSDVNDVECIYTEINKNVTG